MEVLLKETKPALDFEIGDMLVSDKGKCALVGTDEYESCYIAFILGEGLVTDYWCSKEAMIINLKGMKFGEVVRVIKASNLKLIEK